MPSPYPVYPFSFYHCLHEQFYFSKKENLFSRELFYCQILLMDIYMPEKMGIQAAQEIREMGSGCSIIFLTSSKEYALEAYRVDAVQYLLKPISEKVTFTKQSI